MQPPPTSLLIDAPRQSNRQALLRTPANPAIITTAATQDSHPDCRAPLSQIVALHLSDEKKLSIAALSQTLPDRLIEQVMPWSAIRRWNCSLVYWVDSSSRRNSSVPLRQPLVKRFGWRLPAQ